VPDWGLGRGTVRRGRRRLNSSIRSARPFFSTSPLTTPFSGYSSRPQPGGRLPAPRPSVGPSSPPLHLTFKQSTPSLSSGTLVLNTQSSPAVFSLPPSFISVVLPSQQHRSARCLQPATLQLPPPTLVRHRPPVEQEIHQIRKVNLSRRLAQLIRVLDAVQFPSHNEFLPVKRAPASSSQKPPDTALLNHAQGALRARDALMKSIAVSVLDTASIKLPVEF
jgi:hypothetical protein